MAEIIPAVIPRNFRDLAEKLALVSGHVPYAHIDVADASMTAAAYWPYYAEVSQDKPYRDGGEEWQKIQSEETAFPSWEELNFEAHLMVKDPAAIAEDWIRAGAERLIVHTESFEDDEALSNFLQKMKTQFGESEYLKIEIGLAVKFDTPLESIMPHIIECDFIQLMAIPELGEQGEPFQEAIFDRIEKVKYVHPDTIISVDGGVSLENADRLAEAGVARLVAGSAVFAAESPEDALDDLIAATE